MHTVSINACMGETTPCRTGADDGPQAVGRAALPGAGTASAVGRAYTASLIVHGSPARCCGRAIVAGAGERACFVAAVPSANPCADASLIFIIPF